MKRFVPPRLRYPLFFVGLLIIIASGFLNKYAGMPIGAVEVSVVVGFALFLASIVL